MELPTEGTKILFFPKNIISPNKQQKKHYYNVLQFSHLEGEVGCALHEAVEEGVVPEEGELLLLGQVALPLLPGHPVYGPVGHDGRGGDGEEGLGARVEGEAVLDHLGQGHRGVEEGLGLSLRFHSSMYLG